MCLRAEIVNFDVSFYSIFLYSLHILLPVGRPSGVPLLDIKNLGFATKAMGVTVLDDAAAGLPVPQSVVPPFAIIHGGVSNVGANITYMSNPKEGINIELSSRKKATEMRNNNREGLK